MLGLRSTSRLLYVHHFSHHICHTAICFSLLKYSVVNYEIHFRCIKDNLGQCETHRAPCLSMYLVPILLFFLYSCRSGLLTMHGLDGDTNNLNFFFLSDQSGDPSLEVFRTFLGFHNQSTTCNTYPSHPFVPVPHPKQHKSQCQPRYSSPHRDPNHPKLPQYQSQQPQCHSHAHQFPPQRS